MHRGRKYIYKVRFALYKSKNTLHPPLIHRLAVRNAGRSGVTNLSTDKALVSGRCSCKLLRVC
jgi:hypothetical protein